MVHFDMPEGIEGDRLINFRSTDGQCYATFACSASAVQRALAGNYQIYCDGDISNVCQGI
jgi:hypothetical protein